MLLVLSLVSLEALGQEQPSKGVVKVRASYVFQNISFASDAHGANFLVSYDRRRQWGVRGGFHYIDKFGDSAPGYDLGGTWWPGSKTALALDMAWAPKQIVIPRQAYRLEASQIFFKGFVGMLSYRFADYSSANAHAFSPAIDWYFWPRWDWVVKYGVTVSDTGGVTGTTQSVMTRVNWNVIDPLLLFAGFSHGQERFESGSVFNPLGRFSANHGFGGFRWEIYKGWGVDTTFSYENRSNGTTVSTLDTGVSYKF